MNDKNASEGQNEVVRYIVKLSESEIETIVCCLNCYMRDCNSCDMDIRRMNVLKLMREI